MILFGRDIKIYQDGVAIAAAKSCEISMSVDTHEVATLSDVDWRRYKAERSEWTVSVSTLVTEFYTRFNLGQKVTLTMAVCDTNGMTDDWLIGTAWLQKSEISAQLGNLVQGSFAFQGIGVLQPYNLPYDAEIEYLESTGTQYIDTGILFDSACTIKCSVVMTVQNTEFDIVGNIYGSATTSGAFVLGVYNKFIFFYNYPNTRVDSSTYQETENLYNIEVVSNSSGRTLTVNGTSYSKSGASFTNSGSIIIFGGGPSVRLASIKLRSFGITKDGNKVIDHIPVRVGTTGYLFDKVSGQLFGNAGTGAFILGPDKI